MRHQHNGQSNPHTADTTSHDWGIILNGVTAVWRSGLAISADVRTLYYVAGNSLTLSTLVRTLAAIGARAALQLDINVGMVHFGAIQSTLVGRVPAPLFNTMQSQHDWHWRVPHTASIRSRLRWMWAMPTHLIPAPSSWFACSRSGRYRSRSAICPAAAIGCIGVRRLRHIYSFIVGH
ncbi:MAG: hypothetical protein ABIV47_26635 [Roseiflexaceae bacterium]